MSASDLCGLRLASRSFDASDFDGGGVITASDIREAFLFKFDAYDRNGDNRIDFAEFQDLLGKLGEQGSDAKVHR